MKTMGRLLVTALALGATGSAARAGARCAIEVTRAPDDVRAAIARWAAAEPGCDRALTVRVMVDVDGLYVVATDGEGALYERDVPDADAAGALVVSWATTGGVPGPAPTSAPAVEAAPPPAPRVAAIDPVAPLAPPSTEAGDEVAAAPDPTAPRWSSRWVTAGLTRAEHGLFGVGVGGVVEGPRAGRWALGLAASASWAKGEGVGFSSAVAIYETQGLGLAGLVSWTVHRGAWRGRATAALGLGLGRYHFEGMSWSGWQHGGSVVLGAEVQRRLGGRWSAVGAVTATAGGEDLGSAVKAATNFEEREYLLGVTAGVAAAL